jgi:thymidylate synthase
MTVFDKAYQKALKEIWENGIEELSQRTGHKTKSIPGLTIEIPADTGFPLLTLRKIPIKLFVAEQVWFISGSRKPSEFLQEYTRIWDDFTNIDGVVSTAYGWRWRHHFGRDQLGLLVDLLEKEPSSRHGVVIAWDPAEDGLSLRKKKNVPCPYTFTVNIIGGALHMHNIVRSNDMVLGCPHDVAGFALLQRLLAAKLGVKVGKYTHSISNAHVYDVHYDATKELIKRTNNHKDVEITLKKNAFDRAAKQDKELVEDIFQQLKSQYEPSEPIKGLEIVL